jgi:adenosylcobinamide-GDP ribazoletransferase
VESQSIKDKKMKEHYKLFICAVSFLTRIPVPPDSGMDAARLRNAIAYFPLVGTCIGLLTSTLILAGSTVWPIWLAVIAAIAAEALITGAFHEDALADFFDAFFGAWTRERTLEILKDSRLGTYGAAALFFGLFLRTGSLISIAPPALFAALLASATLGRYSIIVVSAIAPPVPERESLAKEVGHLTNKEDLIKGALLSIPGCILWFILMPGKAIITIVLMLLLTNYFAKYVVKRLDGLTGDCMGAICYINQILVLLVAAARV